MSEPDARIAELERKNRMLVTFLHELGRYLGNWRESAQIEDRDVDTSRWDAALESIGITLDETREVGGGS